MDRTRRLRSSEALRSMVRENHVRVEELIYPVVVIEGENIVNPVASMLEYRLTRMKQEAVLMRRMGLYQKQSG